MKTFFLLVATLPLALLIGCSTPGNATLLGAGIGIIAGTGMGLIAPGGRGGQNRPRNIIIGGALGGLLGAGSGLLAQDLIDKSNNEAFKKGTESAMKAPLDRVNATGSPRLVPPQIETRFVDDQTRGTTFIPAHVEFLIVKPARWER